MDHNFIFPAPQAGPAPVLHHVLHVFPRPLVDCGHLVEDQAEVRQIQKATEAVCGNGTDGQSAFWTGSN